MSVSKASDPFFPSIRDAAEQTDQLLNRVDDESGAQDSDSLGEDRPMQEMESLCMACGEQV
jgi:zinc finger protein